jgi:hypothetical protein
MALTFLACRLCAYNAWMPVMALFILFRLGCVAWVAWNRLDVVRVLLMLSGLELAWHQVLGEAILHSSPGDWNGSALASLLELFHATGLPVAVMLKLASGSSFFRGRFTGLSWRHCFTIVPVWMFLIAAQVVWQEWRTFGHL